MTHEHTRASLRDLSSIPAVSGREDLLIGFVADRMRSLGHEPHIDRLGNVSITIDGDRDDCSLLLFAHLDEVGLVVKDVEDDGFVRVERIGGFPEKSAMGALFDVHTLDGRSSVRAVGGTVAHHLTTPDRKFSVPPVQEMYLDLGLDSSAAVRAHGIDVGSVVSYAPVTTDLGEHRMATKALDNRMGVHTMLELAARLHHERPKQTIHLCFSVQEEFTIRGCLPVFQRLEPDAAICLDVTPATDTPDLRGTREMRLGQGPAILYFNFHGRGALAGLIPHAGMTTFIAQVAEDIGVSVQKDVVMGVITDDAYTQTVGPEGVAMAHISVPLRYTHAPTETIDLRDLEAAVELCAAVAARFDTDVELDRGR